MFITFEGIDGSGKTTQIRKLSDLLIQKKIKHTLTREPGGLKVGEVIRNILKTQSLEPMSEVLLLYANRLEHIKNVIMPQQDLVVISDRFDDSTVAYQHYGRGIPLEKIEQIRSITIGDFNADITFLLNISIEERAKRLGDRVLDQIEIESIEFHQRVINGYLKIAAKHPKRIIVIDGTLPEKDILKIIWDKIKEKL
jgi:dTMP kinase